MEKKEVAITKFADQRENIHNVIKMCRGLKNLKPSDRVFLKPNIFMWDRVYPFPKYGVVTTTVVIEEVVKMLKDTGCSNIFIGEATVKDKVLGSSTQAAFQGLGYYEMGKRYGVKLIDFYKERFTNRF